MLKKSAWLLYLTRLYLPHAIVVGLHTHKINIVILTLEAADIILSSSLPLSAESSIQDETMDVARNAD